MDKNGNTPYILWGNWNGNGNTHKLRNKTEITVSLPLTEFK